MLIEKLIEKAFCDGYEYAQREFSFVDSGFKKIDRNSIQKLGDTSGMMKKAFNPSTSIGNTLAKKPVKKPWSARAIQAIKGKLI